ncbi:MAG: 50S ribosomal protein L35 [Candidatus Omnitrophota bacterium]|jgi:large subunit ribosomal protein L35
MAKLKTKKGVAKRFKLTKSKKIKYQACGKSHLSTHKKAKRLRKLRKSHYIHKRKEKTFIKSMLPYG